MPRPEFKSIRRSLIRGGIAPAHAQRTVAELRDHFDDLVDAALRDGHSRPDAEEIAGQKLGDLAAVVDDMRRRPELKSWAWHWPRLAMLVYPLVYVAALPAAPVVAGFNHREALGRWLVGLFVAGLVTFSMFLALQLSITLS